MVQGADESTPGPPAQSFRPRTGAADGLPPKGSNPRAVTSGLDRELLPFLDLVGALIADRILAEATTSAETKVQAPYGAEALIDATATAPGIDGPTPKVPVNPHIHSHSSSTPRTTTEAPRTTTIKEGRRESD
jgi:hypothetical protein